MYILMGYSNSKMRRLRDVSVIERHGVDYQEAELTVNGETMPLELSGHTADLVHDRIYVLGGLTSYGICCQLFVLDLVLQAWSLVDTYHDKHPMLSMHTSVYVQNWRQILCFGGGDGVNFTNRSSCLDIDTNSWYELHAKGAKPSPRGKHLAVLIGSRYFVYGGRSGGTYNWFNDIHILHLCNERGRGAWSSPEVSNAPAVHIEGALGCFSNDPILYGGFRQQCSDNLSIFKSELMSWQTIGYAKHTLRRRAGVYLAPDTRAPPRSGHTLSILDSKTLLLYGGSEFGAEDLCFYTLNMVN